MSAQSVGFGGRVRPDSRTVSGVDSGETGVSRPRDSSSGLHLREGPTVVATATFHITKGWAVVNWWCMVSSRKRGIQVLAITLILVVGSLTVVAPTLAQEDEEDGDGEQPGSQIRLVHAVADGPAVDVYIDGDRVLQEVDPGAVAEYQELEPGNHSLVMVAAEEPGGVILDTRIETEERGNYTVAATGQFEGGDGQTEPVVLLDNATQPPGEFAAIRLAHLVRGAPEVTVTLNETGGVVFEDVAFGDSAPYKTIPGGEYTLDVRTGGADGEIIGTFDADLTGGEATTLFAVGAEDENETLQAIQQTDPIGPEDLTPDIVPEPEGGTTQDTQAEDQNQTDQDEETEAADEDTDQAEETETPDEEDTETETPETAEPETPDEGEETDENETVNPDEIDIGV